MESQNLRAMALVKATNVCTSAQSLHFHAHFSKTTNARNAGGRTPSNRIHETRMRQWDLKRYKKQQKQLAQSIHTTQTAPSRTHTPVARQVLIGTGSRAEPQAGSWLGAHQTSKKHVRRQLEQNTQVTNTNGKTAARGHDKYFSARCMPHRKCLRHNPKGYAEDCRWPTCSESSNGQRGLEHSRPHSSSQPHPLPPSRVADSLVVPLPTFPLAAQP